MKENLVDIQEQLMEMFKTMKDPSLKGKDLEEQIARNMTANLMAKTMVANAALMAGCVRDFHDGNPDLEALPLIPGLKNGGAPKFENGKRRSLLNGSREEGAGVRTGKV
jgi:hypothetical protein